MMLFGQFLRHRLALVSFSASLSVLAASLATTDIALAQSGPKWLPSISFEAKPGTKRNIGEGDLFAPLAQNDSTLLFGNVRARFDDAQSLEGNFGFGLRHMLSSGWHLGVYGYYDRRKTGLDNHFNQATFGVEALGRDFDFRANAYLPFGERVKNADMFNTAVVSGTNVLFYGGEERALRGFDAEVGWRVPIWSADDSKALRLYAGMFRFEDSAVREIIGPRLRAELAVYEVPHLWEGARLTLGAEFQHDDVRGSQGFGLARLSIPLQPPARAVKLTAQERRMTDRIVRDVDIVTQAGAFGKAETVTQLANGKQFSVINSASTAGNDLRSAVAAAGNDSAVILNGTFQVSGANGISMAFGQSLMGGAIGVRTASGRGATLNSQAEIIGTNVTTNGNLVQINAGGTLSGLTIVNNFSGGAGGRAVGVADFATDVTITNNAIAVTQSGNNAALALSMGDNTSAMVKGNTITATGSAPTAAVTAFAAFSTNTVTVTGNSMNASGAQTNRIVWLNNATTINPGSTGNVRGAGACFGASGSGTVAFTDGSSCP